MIRCSHVCLLLLPQALFSVIPPKIDADDPDCEVSLLDFSLLQTLETKEISFQTAHIATTEGSSENASLQRRHRNTTDLALMESSQQIWRLHEVVPRLTWCCGVLLLAVCLALLAQAPQLIRNALRSRQAITCPAAPLEVTNGSHASGRWNLGPVMFWGLLYIAISMTLIKYNKWLMTKGRFPFAVNLTLCHQLSGSVFLFVLYNVYPSLFPSMSGSARDVTLSRATLLGGFLPVALFFSGTLVLSNSAYLYASVAFLQMMKEGNLVLVYLFSLLAGLEVFHSVRAQVLGCLLISTSLTIQGEVSFSSTAFFVQGSSQVMEASKIALQGLLLSPAGSKHLDPYTYNLICQPIVSCIISVLLCACVAFIHHVPLASLADLVAWWPHLLTNCFVALALNITAANFFACSSPMSFMMMGVVKDATIISVDVIMSGTQISGLQIIAFILQLTFVTCYSVLKMFQKELDGNASESNQKGLKSEKL